MSKVAFMLIFKHTKLQTGVHTHIHSLDNYKGIKLNYVKGKTNTISVVLTSG